MKRKAKLLKPFNFLILALILASNFNDSAANDSDEDKGIDKWRIKYLTKFAEIYSSGKPHVTVQLDNVIKFDEFEYFKEREGEYKNLFKTFNEAFKSLVTKIVEFVEINLKNINLSCDIAKVLDEYDDIVKNSKHTEEKREMEKVKEKDETLGNFFQKFR
uniref:DUF148 domain-containing protein n=1 Tax=Meloidogyne hapla TaxID=6305 RepID=A0A1I8BW79_MELHA